MYVKATERFARDASLVLTDSRVSSKSELAEKARIPDEKIKVLYPWVGEEFRRPIPLEDVDRVRRRYQLPNNFWLYLGGYDYREKRRSVNPSIWRR